MILPFLFLIATQLTPKPGEPEFRQPQLAAAQGQTAVAFGSGTSIRFASSVDGGRTFTAPVTVAQPGALALGRHRGPRVTILPDALVITAVVMSAPPPANTHIHGGLPSGNLVVWRSVDHGKSWKQAATVNDVPDAAREGLHTIAADAKGNLYAAWLDLRSKGTKLYGARSADGGRTWSKNALLYASPEGTICQCCDPVLTADNDGTVWAMWRNVIAGSRDLYLAHSHAHSKDGLAFDGARKLGKGTWPLNACPMDGGGMVADHGQVTTVWRRGTDIYAAEPGKDEVRLAEGKDVAIAAGAAGPVAIWSTPHGLQIASPKSPGKVIRISDEGAFPTLVALPDKSLLAAWEEKGSIRVERLP